MIGSKYLHLMFQLHASFLVVGNLSICVEILFLFALEWSGENRLSTWIIGYATHFRYRIWMVKELGREVCLGFLVHDGG